MSQQPNQASPASDQANPASNQTGGGNAPSSQRLIPLFLIAIGLMSVGFYLAYDHRGEVDLGAGQPQGFGETAPLAVSDDALDTSVRAIELVHDEAKPHLIELTLRQKSRPEPTTGEAETLETTIELGLEQDFAEADAARFDRPRVLAITRNYQRAQAKVVTGDGQLIGAGITSQVEELLRGSITRTFVAPSGEPLDFEWREVPNPQARRMLFLMRDAHTFLTPRFFAGAVNPGDTWSYQRPMTVEEPEQGLTAEGQVDIANRFVGVLTHDKRRLGVVRQTLEASTEGTFEAEESSAKFSLEGSGRGLVLVDLDAGRVHAADVSFERTLTIAPTGAEAAAEPTVQVSEISLGLRPEGGVVLPEFQEEQDADDAELEASKKE